MLIYCIHLLYYYITTSLFLVMSRSSCVRFRFFVAWKVHTVGFLSIFLVIIVLLIRILFLVTVSSLSLLFVMLYSIRLITVMTLSWMLASLLPPSFLDTYSLSIWSLRCKILSIVVRFPFLRSISTFIHLKNGPEYLKRMTAEVFIPLMRFMLHSFVSSSFSFSYSF